MGSMPICLRAQLVPSGLSRQGWAGSLGAPPVPPLLSPFLSPLLGVSLEVTSLTVSLSFTLLRTFLSGHFILDENATSLHYTVSWERNHFQIILRYLLG